MRCKYDISEQRQYSCGSSRWAKPVNHLYVGSGCVLTIADCNASTSSSPSYHCCDKGHEDEDEKVYVDEDKDENDDADVDVSG